MLSFTIILLLPFLATLVAAQRIFINQVPAYSSLPTCAEVPLSFIVRDMASGCGDGSKTTSYSCFCTDRSSKMNSIISTAVASRCSTGPISAATEAVEVFASYCGLGNAKYASANTTQAVTAPAYATATVTQTLTPSASTTLPEQTALSPIPSSVAVRLKYGKGRVLCTAMAAVVALGASVA
ncbi:hypothetical protein F4821DRAFT_225431 [Hypoxylon rubiginosum]|uniref:Uncharacterized protein n=1 Tax=Hypoxylon rubiginosum TaxID=110542 RepID=A0ACC0DGQ7_9PEZI|nr:hypothetical protein F4821DRAFT_225431 [Hypoxylon rubiginosum]